MPTTTLKHDKALVLKAFDTLFNQGDYAAAEHFRSDRYIQHSAHIAPGRDRLFKLVRTLPGTYRYENQIIITDGDYVIAQGRFSGNLRPAAWIAADIVRIEDGKARRPLAHAPGRSDQGLIRQRPADVRRSAPQLSLAI